MAVRAAVITFPGSNCDRDMAVAIEPLAPAIKRIAAAGGGPVTGRRRLGG